LQAIESDGESSPNELGMCPYEFPCDELAVPQNSRTSSAVIVLAFRLNLEAIQIVQAAMAPTQLLLIIPFVRLGEWILRAPPQHVSVNEGLALLSHGVGRAIVVLWDAILHAGLAWVLVAPFAVLLFHKLLTPVFERAAAQIKRGWMRNTRQPRGATASFDEIDHPPPARSTAINSGDPNLQHYDLPCAFFELVLGRHLKYSSGSSMRVRPTAAQRTLKWSRAMSINCRFRPRRSSIESCPSRCSSTCATTSG
jgi:hypothetical protein